MAALVQTKYTDDEGDIWKLSMGSAAAAVIGTEPTGVVTIPRYIRASQKGRRRKGIAPRRIELERLVGTAPDQFYRRTSAVVREPSDFSQAGLKPGQTVTFGGNTWTISAQIEEAGR